MMLVLGMIVFSSIVSNVTGATLSLKNITAKYDRQLTTLRRFFQQQGISTRLLVKVVMYADNVIKPKMRGLSLNEIELLVKLPRPMYLEVMGEIYDQYLESLAFFGVMKN